MPVHEFPIQRGEGTRVFADSFFVIKTTAFAEVTHIVDVVAAAAVVVVAVAAVAVVVVVVAKVDTIVVVSPFDVGVV